MNLEFRKLLICDYSLYNLFVQPYGVGFSLVKDSVAKENALFILSSQLHHFSTQELFFRSVQFILGFGLMLPGINTIIVVVGKYFLAPPCV